MRDQLKAIEDNIVDVSFDLECFRTEWATEPPMRGDGQSLDITTFYATNRAVAGADMPGACYGSRLASKVELGKVAVSIPTQHTLGALELPAGWKFWAIPDPSKHFTIKGVTPLKREAALAELGSLLAKARSNSILLFVHGYRVTFVEAALRTAQLAHDLRFPGVAMFYSWPSSGTARAYGHDVEGRVVGALAQQPARNAHRAAGR